MSKIKFRGEKMELPEARLYIDKLKTGAIPIELNEGEKRGYELFKETNHGESEREYLIGTIEALIAIEEHLDRIKNN